MGVGLQLPLVLAPQPFSSVGHGQETMYSNLGHSAQVQLFGYKEATE